MKSKYKKSNYKVSSKRCGQGESSDDAPPCGTLVHLREGGTGARAPAVPVPRLGWLSPNMLLWWMSAAGQEPSQLWGWEQGLSTAPCARSPQAHFIGNGQFTLWVIGVYRGLNRTSKAFFYHHGPYRAPAMSVSAHMKTIVEPSPALIVDFLFCT